jgi:hypothetical protein
MYLHRFSRFRVGMTMTASGPITARTSSIIDSNRDSEPVLLAPL